jgi:hypothetical protein
MLDRLLPAITLVGVALVIFTEVVGAFHGLARISFAVFWLAVAMAATGPLVATPGAYAEQPLAGLPFSSHAARLDFTKPAGPDATVFPSPGPSRLAK